MKTAKPTLSVLLALLLCLSLGACGATPASSAAPAASGSGASAAPSAPAGPAELSVLMVGDNTPPDTNAVLKELEARTNTKLTMTYVARKDLSAKLNTLIAAKQLPDVVRLNQMSDIEQLKANGMLANMAPYLADAKSITENLGDSLYDHPVNTKDEVYAIFNAEYAYPQNMCVRTDWLEKLNLEMPTDLDSLYNVLKAFKEKDPDGNGANDTIPMGASISVWNNFTNILGAFNVPACSDGLRPYQMPDGTVTTSLKNPGFVEACKYFNKLYREGLMEPDFATIPNMDSFGKVWNGKVGVFDFQCPGPTNNWMPGRYVENPPPTFGFAEIKGPTGVAAQAKLHALYAPAIVVSAGCKDPAAAVRFIDYLMSEEGSTLTYLGVEGVHYNWVDKAAATYKMIAPFDDSTTNRNDGVFVYSEFIRPKAPAERRLFNEQTRSGVASAEKMCTIEWPYVYRAFDADVTYGVNLRTIEKEVFCQMVSAKSEADVETLYKQGVARWENEGGLDWEKEATATYQAQK